MRGPLRFLFQRRILGRLLRLRLAIALAVVLAVGTGVFVSIGGVAGLVAVGALVGIGLAALGVGLRLR